MISESISLERFLRAVYVPRRLELRAESVEQLGYAIRLLERHAGRILTIYDLHEDLIVGWLRAMLAERSPATVNSKRTQILSLWQAAYDEGYLERPPRRAKIPRAREAPAIPEAWSAEEVGHLLAAADRMRGCVGEVPANRWWRAIILVAYDTATRRSELLRLRWCDVQLERACLVVARQKQGTPRWCAIAPETVQALAAIQQHQSSLVFPWPHEANYLTRRLRRLALSAGLRVGRGAGGVWHKLRRTSGSLVESHGGDGARHIGDTRTVFERHYRDPRMVANTLAALPRPI